MDGMPWFLLVKSLIWIKMITTFLHDGELNQPLPFRWMDEVLLDVRTATKENYQVVNHPSLYWGWEKKWGIPVKRVLLSEDNWALYRWVGGCGPWQQINFFRAVSTSSINPYANNLDLIISYLFGILAGINDAKINDV